MHDSRPLSQSGRASASTIRQATCVSANAGVPCAASAWLLLWLVGYWDRQASDEVWGGDVAWPALPEVVAIMVNRRDFIGGALCGSAAVVGGGARPRPTVAEPPTPPAPAPALPDHARLSFSQQGEDIVLYHVLHDLLEIAVPTFMDVGAAYPVQGNNTYLLYTTGARGVLVEPNPTFAAELRRHRPGDTVIQAGIGVGKAREANYYEIEGYPVLNTFSPRSRSRL